MIEESRNPDYSRPPPGYLPSGERLGPTTSQPISLPSISQIDQPSSDRLTDQSNLHTPSEFSSTSDHPFQEPRIAVSYT